MTENALCWIDGSILPAGEARVSVFDHGLLYGDGVFEGLRFYHGKTFMLWPHLERLGRSAAAIGLELPYSLPRIAAAIEALIAACGRDSGYLRLVVTRGPGSLGIDPRSCARPLVFIIADTLSVIHGDAAAGGVSLHVSSVRRMPAACLDPAVKSLNYLNNILARIEACGAGADEALMLNLDGFVCEGSVDNIFVASNGMLRTPPLGDGLLPGITRALVIDIARELGITCEETRLRPRDLFAADECFLSGTGAELIPVRQIDGRHFEPPAQPLLPRIRRAFEARIASECGAG